MGVSVANCPEIPAYVVGWRKLRDVWRATNAFEVDPRLVTEIENATVLVEARRLMAEALRLLDVAQAWEPSAHLDFAIQRLDTLLAALDDSGSKG